jgi:flagellar biosynthesis/type III secretory pathway protein FliH
MIASKEVITMNVNRNLVRNWQDDAALERFQMIAPLLDADLDPAKRIQLRRQTAEQNGLSEKTISRYERSFREGGFEGLKPKSGGSRNRNSLPENYDELIEEAKQLRREVPSRSVEKVITIL